MSPIICYLNDVKSGGETSFDKLGFAVAPIQGRALVFYPTVPGGSLEADDRLTHESVVASNEEKYTIQMFWSSFHASPRRLDFQIRMPRSYSAKL